MNWYKYSQEIISPEEMQYQEEWGEHHGPVSMKRDTWNFGPKGYPTESGPMPLPKKLYHVTPFPQKILQEGFKIFTEPSQQTFGGHGQYTSFTTLENAKIYQEALKDYITLANMNFISWEDFVNKIKPFLIKWQIKDSWLNLMKSHLNTEQKQDPNIPTPNMIKQILAENIGIMHIFSKNDSFPIFISSKDTFKRFQGMSPNNVKIIETETQPVQWHFNINISPEEMSDKYTYNKSENEWRIWNPQHIKPVKIIN